MRKIMLTTALLVLAAGPMAVAQTTDRAGASSQKQTPWPAPVGHRQPRTDQVPPESNLNSPNDAGAREDAALDRKIKSICRGC